MRTKTKTLGALSLMAVASMFLFGCTSVRALSSTPPVKQLVLERPAEFALGWGRNVSLAAGEYKAVMEDNNGYYYQPSKTVYREICPYVLDCGLYVRRGETVPSRWYAFVQGGQTKTGKLPKDFQTKLIE